MPVALLPPPPKQAPVSPDLQPRWGVVPVPGIEPTDNQSESAERTRESLGKMDARFVPVLDG